MDEELPQPLDMSWPETNRKRLTYILILPLILPLWITLPDTRKPESKKFFSITFLGSILWIAVFSYLMVWWATITGEAFSIPPEVSQNKYFNYLLAQGPSGPELGASGAGPSGLRLHRAFCWPFGPASGKGGQARVARTP